MLRIRFFGRKRRRGARGLTLIEVVTAVGILAFCLSGLLLTYMNLAWMSDVTRDFTMANNAMQARMEEIRRYPFVDLSLLDNQTFDLGAFAASNNATAISRVYDTDYADLKRVRLVVTFNSHGEQNRTFTTDMVTLITNFTGVN